jgi:hypothetical protein
MMIIVSIPTTTTLTNIENNIIVKDLYVTYVTYVTLHVQTNFFAQKYESHLIEYFLYSLLRNTLFIFWSEKFCLRT